MIWDNLFLPFYDYAFMRRALYGCIAISVSATPIGVFLILRRMSLTGDAIACAILPGAAIGYLISGLSLGSMTIGGVVAGLTVALLSGLVSRITALREDASLAAFYIISLALGVVIVSTRGSNIDLMHILFGTVLALDNPTLTLLSTITTLSTITLVIFFRPLVLECVDPHFLRSVSSMSTVTHFTFLSLVVLNLVGGFHALGTLMAVGIMILPAAGARFWAVSLGGLITIAFVIATLSSLFGLLLSFNFSLPSGPAIILVAGTAYLFSLAFGSVDGIVTKSIRKSLK